jgi:nitrite reductase/ring-hydroxylating ferredoxin subunit
VSESETGSANAAAPEGAVLLSGISAAAVEPLQLYKATMPNGTALCVGRHADSFFAMKDYCPHREYPLSEGTLYPNGEIECSWHGARFACATGKVTCGPAESDLLRFEVIEVSGALYVRRASGAANVTGGGL